MFHVGQIVACIYDGREHFSDSPLLKGTVYTIRDIKTSMWRGEPADALWFVEVEPPMGWFGFAGPCFRPLKDTALEVFRQIAIAPRKPIRVSEDA